MRLWIERLGALFIFLVTFWATDAYLAVHQPSHDPTLEELVRLHEAAVPVFIELAPALPPKEVEL